MKKWLIIFIVLCVQLIYVYTVFAKEGPLVTQSKDWQYIVNNAYRTADDYASKHNSASTFICASKDVQFIKQMAGKYKGRYLLLITCKHSGNISFATLLPNFDVNSPASKLNDEDPNLWTVVGAKYNGINY